MQFKSVRLILMALSQVFLILLFMEGFISSVTNVWFPVWLIEINMSLFQFRTVSSPRTIPVWTLSWTRKKSTNLIFIYHHDLSIYGTTVNQTGDCLGWEMFRFLASGIIFSINSLCLYGCFSSIALERALCDSK